MVSESGILFYYFPRNDTQLPVYIRRRRLMEYICGLRMTKAGSWHYLKHYLKRLKTVYATCESWMMLKSRLKPQS